MSVADEVLYSYQNSLTLAKIDWTGIGNLRTAGVRKNNKGKRSARNSRQVRGTGKMLAYQRACVNQDMSAYKPESVGQLGDVCTIKIILYYFIPSS